MKIAITGTSSGIGLRSAVLFAERGHQVVGLVRDVQRGARALDGVDAAARDRISLRELDLASHSSIRGAADHLLSEGPLDALVNNAATFDLSVRDARTTVDGHELFWATNHLGPTELTARLSPALASAGSPSIVFVASKGLVTLPRIRIRFDALDGSGWFTPTRAYYHAKLAQVMTAMSLAERAPRSWRISCVRVPAVRLDADRLSHQPPILRALYAPKNRLAASPDSIAEAYLSQIEGEPRNPSDVYVDEHGSSVSPPRFARDDLARRKLWECTQEQTEVTSHGVV